MVRGSGLSSTMLNSQHKDTMGDRREYFYTGKKAGSTWASKYQRPQLISGIVGHSILADLRELANKEFNEGFYLNQPYAACLPKHGLQ